MPRETFHLRLDRESPESIAMRRITEHYGSFCTPGLKRYDPIRQCVSVPILADVPIRLFDERREKDFVQWINLGEIGEILVSEGEAPVEVDAPDYRSLLRTAQDKLMTVRGNLEMELLTSCQHKFGFITPIVNPWFSPLLTMFSMFREAMASEEASPTVHLARVLDINLGGKYYPLLTKSRLATTSETREGILLHPTDDMVLLFEHGTSDRQHTFEEYCVGRVIQQTYPTILEEFHMPTLTSYVRFANSLYEASFEAGQRLDVSVEGWINRTHRKRYGRATNSENLRHQTAPNLRQAGIVELEHGFYRPAEEIFEDYCDAAQHHLQISGVVPLDRW